MKDAQFLKMTESKILGATPSAKGFRTGLCREFVGTAGHPQVSAPNNRFGGGSAEMYTDNDNLAMLDVAAKPNKQTAPNNGWV